MAAWESVDYQRAGADHPRTRAFHAAYATLGKRGVDLATVRAHVADIIADRLDGMELWRLQWLRDNPGGWTEVAQDIRSASTGILPRAAVIAAAVRDAVRAIVDGDE